MDGERRPQISHQARPTGRKPEAAHTLRTVLVTAAIAFPIGLLAAPMKGHPNLLAARGDADKAWDKITAAQNANEFDVAGHAAKAKDALKIAVDELKLAAETSNQNYARLLLLAAVGRTHCRFLPGLTLLSEISAARSTSGAQVR